MSKLLSSFGKRGINLGLDVLKVDINDTSHLSKYFVISEFDSVLTSGKNPVSFNGSSLLKSGSEILIECLDSEGNSMYIERPKGNVSYTDVSNFIISIHIYNEAYNGNGKLIFVGTTKKGESVRWIGNIAIDKTLQNTSKVRFYNKPSLECRGVLYPVVTNEAASELTKTISIEGSVYSLPLIPKKDENKINIDSKKTDIDYRITFNTPVDQSQPTLYPTTSFNTQMEGQNITVFVNTIQSPFSYSDTSTDITQSFKIKKVLNSSTIQVAEPLYISYGKDQIISSINHGEFTSSYTWVAYNTASDAYLKYTNSETGLLVYGKQSYAEVVYRNIRTFSGFVARHKLYRKSLIYPGDFQLVVDEPLGARELLIDPVTNNKTYNLIGEFYNQRHINKYWYTSSNSVQLSHSTTPYINAVRIASPNYADMDGTKYIIAKADSAGTINDEKYIPYNSASFYNITGSSYNSNFISLKKDTLYVISTNIVAEKNKHNVDAKVSFYLTGSIPSMKLEKTYVEPYGLKMGEILIPDITNKKVFSEKQMIFFTPVNDYYGTLIIIPYQCNITLSELSLKVYGDYGFSPDVLFSNIPFQINIKGEPFQIRSELFDINSNLVYSDLKTIQTFDVDGVSLFTFIGDPNLDPRNLSFIKGSLTVSQSLFLPNISSCPSVNTRLLAYHYPTHTPPRYPPQGTDGQVCHTNIIELKNFVNSNNEADYISLSTIAGVTTTVGRSISAKYGSGHGRKIFIDSSGTKTELS